MPSAVATRLRAARGVHPSVWALVALMAAYVAVFGTLTWKQQSNYSTFGFDMGIYDQGIWLLSRFEEPFVTIRGLNYFGHHVNVITVLFVPFYWLGAGPHFLYLVETLWLAAGAVPVWLLARDRLGDRWLALALAACFLLYPALQWQNWWHFHPDPLIITPLVFAWWLARRRSWRWFAVAVAVAMLCKEDAALAVGVLGIVLALRGDRRQGLITFAVATAWFLLCTRVIIPTANGGLGPLYDEFFPGLGDTVPEIIWNAVRHPSRLYEALWTDGPTGTQQYYWKLLGPVALLPPVLALPALAVGAPQTLVNVVSSHSPTHDIHYHYSAVVTAAIFIATVEGLRRFRPGSRRAGATVAVLVASVLANVAWSPSPAGRDHDAVWAQHPGPKQESVDAALELLPDGAGVSAVYYVAPHVTHRQHAYEWPNPFRVANWGVRGSAPPDPADADWLVLDRDLLGDTAPLLDELLGSGEFRLVYDSQGIVVAQRARRGVTAGTAGT